MMMRRAGSHNINRRQRAFPWQLKLVLPIEINNIRQAWVMCPTWLRFTVFCAYLTANETKSCHAWSTQLLETQREYDWWEDVGSHSWDYLHEKYLVCWKRAQMHQQWLPVENQGACCKLGARFISNRLPHQPTSRLANHLMADTKRCKFLNAALADKELFKKCTWKGHYIYI